LPDPARAASSGVAREKICSSVKVLPDPVWPYVNSVECPPHIACWISGAAASP
jgi:hypothetical protein